MEALNEVRVKDEPISDNQSISETIEATSNNNQPKKGVKEKRIDIEIEKSKEIVLKAEEEEEKFSTTEEFMNKASIAFLNEETKATRINDSPTSVKNQPTTDIETNNERNEKSK